MTSDIEKKFQILHQFVKDARSNLDDGAWDYLVGGAETETTQKRNRLGFDKLAFRPRVMRDVSGLNASVDSWEGTCVSPLSWRRLDRCSSLAKMVEQGFQKPLARLVRHIC